MKETVQTKKMRWRFQTRILQLLTSYNFKQALSKITWQVFPETLPYETGPLNGDFTIVWLQRYETGRKQEPQ